MRDHLDIWGPLYFIFGIPFLMFLVAFLTGCGPKLNYAPLCEAPPVAAASGYVVGGVPSVDRRATVKVFTAGGSCSGTVVGPYTVLTAGHCKDPEVVAVEDFGAFAVIENIAHPDYNGNTRTDLRLAYTENELPAPFAEIATSDLSCEQLVVQGYGIGSDGELHERAVDTVVRYSEIIIVTEGGCNGDSGGPLWALRADGSYVQAGVVSFGAGPAPVCESVGGYMNLMLLGDWVTTNLR